MAIKVDGQSNTINDFYVKDSGGATHPVTLFEKNGVVVYARPGWLEFIQPGHSLPDHITSLAASRASTLEPSASTGPLVDGARIYHGDVINFTLTPENYYTATYNNQITTNFLHDTKVYGTVAVEPVTTTPLNRDLKFTLGDGIAKISAMNGSATYSIFNNSTLTVWQGEEWTFGATRATYWTNATVSPASAAKGAATVNISASAERYMRPVVHAGGNYDILTITYCNSAGNPVTVTTHTIAGLVDAWTGGDVDYSWTRASYYLPGSGHLDPSEDARTFAVTAGRKPSTVSITGTSHRTITVTGWDVNDSTLTHSSSAATASWDDYWSGARVDWNVDYERYWTGTQISGSVAASEDTRTIDVSATKAPRNLYLYPSGRATIQAWYNTVSGTDESVTADHADVSKNDLWQGGTVSTYAVAADTYCTYSVTTANLGDSESDASITANVTGLTRTLTVRSGSNISALQVTYQDSNFTTHTVSISDVVTHTYDAWQGKEITYTCSAYSYYTPSVTASGLGVGDSNASIVASTDMLYRNIVLTMNTGVSSVYFDATGGLSGGDVTYTQSGTYSVWQGYRYSLQAFADTYYESPTVSTSTISEGPATAYITASVSKKPGTIYLGSKPTGLNYLDLSSSTIYDQSWTARATTATTYTLAVWSGAVVDWVATYLSGYTGDRSGSIVAAEGVRQIPWPTAIPRYYVDYTNNTGTTAIVDAVSVASGATYRFRYPAATTITITGGSALSTTDSISTGDSGTTRSIAIESTSKYMGNIYKSSGEGTLVKTKSFSKPDGAPGYVTSSNWSLTNIYGGSATISSHGGGSGGYDNVTVRLSASSVGPPANVDVYFYPVQQTVIRGSGGYPTNFWISTYSSYWLEDSYVGDGQVSLTIGIENKTSYSVNVSINPDSYLDFPDDRITAQGMTLGSVTTLSPNTTTYIYIDMDTVTNYSDISDANACEIIFTATIDGQDCGDGTVYEI